MSRHNFLPPYNFIAAGDMSGNLTGPTTDISYLDNIAIHLIFTGTPTGTFTVQGSVKASPATTDWVALPLSPAPAATGSGSSILINLNFLGFPYIRVLYTATSGAGTLNAYISGKMV